MKNLAFLVLTVTSSQVFAAASADTVGLHISFKSKTVDQTCDDIWTALKTDNYPQLDSFGGQFMGNPEGGCKGYKNIKGPGADVASFQSEIVSNFSGYELSTFYIGENRAEGHFSTDGLNIDLPFKLTFKTFSDYVQVLDVFHSGTAQTLPELFRNVFKSEENAQKLEEYFANGNCLNEFSVKYRWYGTNDGKEIKMANKKIWHGEVCPE